MMIILIFKYYFSITDRIRLFVFLFKSTKISNRTRLYLLPPDPPELLLELLELLELDEPDEPELLELDEPTELLEPEEPELRL